MRRGEEGGKTPDGNGPSEINGAFAMRMQKKQEDAPSSLHEPQVK